MTKSDWKAGQKAHVLELPKLGRQNYQQTLDGALVTRVGSKWVRVDWQNTRTRVDIATGQTELWNGVFVFPSIEALESHQRACELRHLHVMKADDVRECLISENFYNCTPEVVEQFRQACIAAGWMNPEKEG